MTVIKHLRALLTADTGDYIQDMKKAGSQTREVTGDLKKAEAGPKGFASSLGGLKGAFTSLVGAGLILKAGQELLAFGKASVQAASDVAEMRSKFGIVFKDQADAVENELDRMGKTINRSKFDLMGYAATFQDTFVPLGFARDEAAKMSVQLVLLAEDLASFNNLKTPDVARDLQSALVGNVETLRKYGVVANEAAIKSKAMSLGLWDGKGAIDANAKAQAILAITVAGTADAQGDAERTSDSYANQMKGLEAATLNLKVAMGEALLPTLEKGIPILTNWINTMATGQDNINKINQALAAGAITDLEALHMKQALEYGTRAQADVMAELTAEVEKYNRAIGRTQGEKERVEAYKSATEAAEDYSGAIGRVAYETRLQGEAAKGSQEKTENWLGALDTGLSNTISSMLDQLEFFTSGGGELQAAAEAVRQAIIEKRITPEQGREYLGQIFVASEELQVELGNLNAREAEKNIKEQLGGSVQAARDKLALFKGEAKFKIISEIELKIKATVHTYYVGPGAGGRAGGGPVYGGQSYTWNEPGSGPEVLVPAGNGYVLNREQAQAALAGAAGGGGGETHNHFYNQGVTALALASQSTKRWARLSASMGRA